MRSRFLAFLLALLTASSLIISCAETKNEVVQSEGSAPDTQENTDETAEDTVLYDNLPDVSFGGYDFRVLSCVFVGRELAEFLIMEQMDGDVVNDAVYESCLKISERFDVKFRIIHSGDINSLAKTVRQSVSADSDDFDIQCGQDLLTVSLSQNGMFCNMFNVEQFDFSRPWWPDNIVSQLALAGKLYVGSSYLTYNGLHWTRVLIANKDKFAEYTLEIPYDRIISGDWYMDDLIELVSGTAADINGNGKMDSDDFYGFMMGCGSAYCLQDDFGIKFYEKSDDALTVCEDHERTVHFLEIMKKLADLPDYTYGGTAENEFSSEIFRNKKVLIGTTMIGTAYDEFRNTDINYAIMPYPKLDELQENYINTCTDAFWAIPVTAYNNIDVIGTVVEALSCSNYQNVLPAYFEVALKTKLADSPDDAALFDIIRDTRTIGFEFAYSITYSNIYDTCIVHGQGFESYFTSQLKSAQRKADKLFEKFANQN